MTSHPNPLRSVLAPARSIGAAWLATGRAGCRAAGPDGAVVELSGECVGAPTASAPLSGRLRRWHLEVFGDGHDVELRSTDAERLAADAELLSALADRTSELADTTGALIDANDQLLAMYGLAESSTAASADRNVIADLTDEARRLTRSSAVLVSLENGIETSAGPEQVVGVLRSARDGSNDRVMRAGADQGFDVAARRLKGNTAGEILIASTSGQRFTTPDLQRIDAVTSFMSGIVSLEMMHRAALASAVIERDAATAAQLAQMVLPTTTPDIDGLDMAARCDPARLAAGDFYTWIDTSDGIVFAVGDVSGKGLAAAMVMTMVTRATVRTSLAMPGADPTEIFSKLAGELTDDLTEASVFVTMVIGSYRPGDDVIRLANAGHSPVLVRTADGTAPFPASAPPLGVLADFVPDTVEMPFTSGDTIMIGTDGLAEQQDGTGAQIGYDHLVGMVDTHADGGAGHLVAELFAAVERFAGEHDQDDDRTALVLHRTERDARTSPADQTERTERTEEAA